MIELDHIYNQDCLEGMKMIPDGSVDAVIGYKQLQDWLQTTEKTKAKNGRQEDLA